MVTVLMSGGHLTPALAVIDYAQSHKKAFRFVFLGRKYSQESSKQISQEENEVKKRNVVFIETLAPKVHKTYWWNNIIELRKLPRSLWIAWKTISTHKPDIFLSFGGYLAFPIAFVCRVRRIPVITHEQTRTKGLANHVIAFLSDKVAVSYSSSLDLFPKSKSILTGNPIRPSILTGESKKPKWITDSTKPILYITGGNQGSEVLNRVVEQTLSALIKDWYIIHQCGNPSRSSNYYDQLIIAQQKLPASQQKHFTVRTWIDEKELSWIYEHAKGAVSRSGANTVLELIVHCVPSVLIPLPFSHNNEQFKNAESLAQAKSAILLQQKDLTPEKFLSCINSLKENNKDMQKNAQELKKSTILNGSENLIELIESVVQKS